MEPKLEMSVRTKDLYKQLKLSIHANQLSESHSLFKSYAGFESKNDSIMFVGRDTNGIWESVDELCFNDFGENELTWLNSSYKYSTSPFWRTIGKTMSNLTKARYDYEIYKRVIWTNLYKIGRRNENSAVKGAVKNIQQDICAELLMSEIYDLEPQKVIFLTGDFLDPFIGRWQEKGMVKDVKSHSYKYLKTFSILQKDGGKIEAISFDHPQSPKTSEQRIIDLATQFYLDKDKFYSYIKDEVKDKNNLFLINKLKDKFISNENCRIWIWRKERLVFDYCFAPYYKIAIDIYIEQGKWKVDLFGRNKRSISFLINNILPKISTKMQEGNGRFYNSFELDNTSQVKKYTDDLICTLGTL